MTLTGGPFFLSIRGETVEEVGALWEKLADGATVVEAQRGVSWHALAVHIGPAAATQRLCGIRQRNEITTGADRTEPRHGRDERRLQHGGEAVDHVRRNAGAPRASDHTVVQAGLKESAAPVRPVARFRRDIDGDWRGRPPQISWPQRRRQADDAGVRGAIGWLITPRRRT
jgi:hypothetical protein